MKHPFWTMLIVFLPFFSFAQNNLNFKPAPFGAINIGYSIVDELLPEGYFYNPQTLLGSIDIWKRKYFSIYSELQFVHAYNSVDMKTDFEFGANLGLMFSMMVLKRLQVSAAIGSGPHYVTVQTTRQASGFIFSDNVEAGITYEHLRTKTSYNLRVRFRHISNAGLKAPNGGIDNLFLVLGMSILLD